MMDSGDNTDYCLRLLKQIKSLKEENTVLKNIVLEQNDRLAVLEDERKKMLGHISFLYEKDKDAPIRRIVE
jgi:hypothetical protein